MKANKTINIRAKYVVNPNMSVAVKVFLLPLASPLIRQHKSDRGILSLTGAWWEIALCLRCCGHLSWKVRGQLEQEPIKALQIWRKEETISNRICGPAPRGPGHQWLPYLCTVCVPTCTCLHPEYFYTSLSTRRSENPHPIAVEEGRSPCDSVLFGALGG